MIPVDIKDSEFGTLPKPPKDTEDQIQHLDRKLFLALISERAQKTYVTIVILLLLVLMVRGTYLSMEEETKQMTYSCLDDPYTPFIYGLGFTATPTDPRVLAGRGTPSDGVKTAMFFCVFNWILAIILYIIALSVIVVTVCVVWNIEPPKISAEG